MAITSINEVHDIISRSPGVTGTVEENFDLAFKIFNELKGKQFKLSHQEFDELAQFVNDLPSNHDQLAWTIYFLTSNLADLQFFIDFHQQVIKRVLKIYGINVSEQKTELPTHTQTSSPPWEKEYSDFLKNIPNRV